jgi:hypothetical protein
MGFFLRLFTGSDPFKQLRAYCLKFGRREGSYMLAMKNGKILYDPGFDCVQIWCENPNNPNEFGVLSKDRNGYATCQITDEKIPLDEILAAEHIKKLFAGENIKNFKMIPKEVADELAKIIVKQLEAVFG